MWISLKYIIALFSSLTRITLFQTRSITEHVLRSIATTATTRKVFENLSAGSSSRNSHWSWWKHARLERKWMKLKTWRPMSSRQGEKGKGGGGKVPRGFSFFSPVIFHPGVKVQPWRAHMMVKWGSATTYFVNYQFEMSIFYHKYKKIIYIIIITNFFNTLFFLYST